MQTDPRKQPRQARAKATEAAIIEAAARILDGPGPESLTTNLVAEHAGVSIGSLYQYFPNKQAILVALIRRERAALLDAIRAIAATPGPDAIDRLIDAGLAHQFARPRLALHLEALERSLPLDAEARALTQDLARTIATLLETPEDPDTRDVIAICQTLINTAALAGDTDTDALKTRLRRAVLGYLG